MTLRCLIARCWGPKFHKKAHSMKSKERSWALTKEGLIHEVKKDHEGSKSQKEWKKKEIIITKKEKGKKKKNA